MKIQQFGGQNRQERLPEKEIAMKKYMDSSAVQWDAWFVNRDTAQGVETHAFYLQNGPMQPATDPRTGWAVGHAASSRMNGSYRQSASYAYSSMAGS